MKPLASLLVLLPFLIGCATTRVERIINDPVQTTVVRVGVMLKRMGESPTLTVSSNGAYAIQSTLAAFSASAVSTNATQLRLTCPGVNRAGMLLSLIDQTLLDSPNLPITSEGRSLPGLFGLHFIAPSFSAVYSGHENPYAGKRSVWLRFFLHLGVDALGTTATATEGYRKSFRFNGGTLAFLLFHRLVTLPSIVVETDLYNRTLRAGYKLRF